MYKYFITYSPLSTLSKEGLNKLLEEKQSLEFCHSLEQQIGGQIEAGFMITVFLFLLFSAFIFIKS
ncbi:hypothetical protein [Clostridium sporogenes]|uniref:hypothetical protein n=1 Tax=Clostridium sporogenes TaxID=1509 RepID=UPI001FAD5CE8|nr:hypothetical protein [Clostridium sporogenes]